MQVRNLHSTGWPSNCYLVSEGNDAVIIDPSAPASELTRALANSALTLRAILLTHGHFDHILSLDALRDATGAPAYLHCGDENFPGDPAKSCYLTLIGQNIRHRPAEVTLKGRAELEFGALHFTVLPTPGHTEGCVCYRCIDALFTGDTLFANGVGRTDLPGGSPAAQRDSLNLLRQLALREPNLIIYPGHGGTSSLGAAIAICSV